MLDTLTVYVPEDRRQAGARGETLPKRMQGAALYADISGFTPLTEALVQQHGPQRGAEELTQHLDRVYNILIEQVHQYSGSVIGYSGDAITCWFHGDDGQRAIAAAFGMQQAMKQVAAIAFPSGESISVAVKVAVVVGIAHRLMVGDPSIQLIDVLGGAVVERLALASQIVHPGEVILDGETARHLTGTLIPGEQRLAPDGSESFVVVAGLLKMADSTPWPDLPMNALTEQQLRPWVLPALYERMQQGHGQFLMELRPAVALFLSIRGIDYENNPAAGEQLDAYVRWAQAVLMHYEGVLLQVVLGEKGSYLYGVFGAPVVHEDDARRAVAAALELHTPPPSLAFIQPVSIGLSRGVVRTGPMGSMTRRIYGVLGDEVNVASRLMEAAAPGEILATERVIQRLGNLFEIESLPPLRVKGKSQPLPVYRIQGIGSQAQHVKPNTSQLVGRAAERARLEDVVTALLKRQSRVVIIEGEAGIGKSRLVMDWLDGIDLRRIKTLTGAGDAIEQSTPYHAWRLIFSQLLDWDALPNEREARLQYVHDQLHDLGLAARAPLLNSVLPLDLPDNDLTLEMTGKVRADNTHDVLVALLQHLAAKQPLLIIIEDAHWLDSASWALMGAVVRQVRPLAFALATRPLTSALPEYQFLFEQPDVVYLKLQALRSEDAVQLVCQRLGVDVLPEPVTHLILEKAEGHPFFSEELAYALRDSGVLRIVDGQAFIAPNVDFKNLNLPDTVEGVVTSRIDLLAPGQQLVVKVASVIGRVFDYQVLEQVHPVETDRPKLTDYLQHLQNLDVTPLVTPLPDLSYMFKHIITQEVAYNLLLFAQRRQLHQAVAEWYEQAFAKDLSPFYPLLAHHWLSASETTSNNTATLKAIAYLEKAGEMALRSYANREAAEYFNKLLTMVTPKNASAFNVTDARMAQWEYQLGEAYNRLGDMVKCEQHFTESLTYLHFPLPPTSLRLAFAIIGNILRQARIRLQRSNNTKRPQLTESDLEARRLACKIYERLGLLYFLKNDLGLKAFYSPIAALDRAEEIGPSPELAIAYSYIAGAAGLVPVHRLARLYERLSVQTAEATHNPLIMARVLMATSVYSAGAGRLAETDERLQHAIAAFEQGGVWEWWGVCMEMLTRVTNYQGQLQRSAELADRLYAVTKQQGDNLQQSWALTSRMEVHLLLMDHDDILTLAAEMEELAVQTHETGSLQKSLGVSALTHLWRGEWLEADQHAGRLLNQISSESSVSFGLLPVYIAVTETYLNLWERRALPDTEYLKQQATLACKMLKRYAKTLPVGESAKLRAEGLHAWLSGNPKQAYTLWHQSLTYAEGMHMPLEVARTNYELGRHLSAADPLRRKYLEQAQQLFQQLGVRYYDFRIRDALRATGN